MKPLLSFLAISLLSATAANAGTLNCVSERIAYSADHTDGGAPRDPIITLVVDGRVMIRTGMFEPNPVTEADFELVGSPRVIKKVRRDRQHVVTYFEQVARVTQQNVDPVLFEGEVLCKEVRYVGPPRP